MRVLIAAAVMTLTGCYEPGVSDCQFSCGAGEVCPADTTCMGGFCRTTSSGSCSTIRVDAAFDAPLDADVTSCPPPPQSNCGARFTLPGGTCAVICSSEKWDEAANLCGNGAWEAGKLDNLAQVEALNPADEIWTGASRSSGWTWRDGSAIPAALWTGGVAPTSGASCGHLTVQRRLANSLDCNEKLPRLCTEK